MEVYGTATTPGVQGEIIFDEVLDGSVPVKYLESCRKRAAKRMR
jgi:hypothetical protein